MIPRRVCIYYGYGVGPQTIIPSMGLGTDNSMIVVEMDHKNKSMRLWIPNNGLLGCDRYIYIYIIYNIYIYIIYIYIYIYI